MLNRQPLEFALQSGAVAAYSSVAPWPSRNGQCLLVPPPRTPQTDFDRSFLFAFKALTSAVFLALELASLLLARDHGILSILII